MSDHYPIELSVKTTGGTSDAPVMDSIIGSLAKWFNDRLEL